MTSQARPQNWLERLPDAGQTCVFTGGYYGSSLSGPGGLVTDWKRDALLFDRVYAACPDPNHPPDIPIELSFGVSTLDADVHRYTNDAAQCIAQAYPAMPWEELESTFPEIGGMCNFDFKLTETYAAGRVMGEWSYSGRNPYLRRFGEGEKTAWEGALNNIPLVSTANVSWEQIIDFRSDHDAARKYRDLRLWLRSGLNATSVQHATDIIGQKIEDYRWSIRKHSFETTLGAIRQLFEWKQSGLALAAGGAGAVAGGNMGAALAGGLVILAQATAFLCERRLAQHDITHGPDRGVAILYEAQERFAKA